MKSIVSSTELVMTAEQAPVCTPPTKKFKTGTRDTFNSVKLSVLMAAHGKHFADWCKTRKKGTKQLIPRDIWPKVFVKVSSEMLSNYNTLPF
jgi:hypothetical protein